MYNRNKVVIMTVCVLFIAEVAAMCTILVLTVPKFESTPQCLITSTPKLFPSYWCGSFRTSRFPLILTVTRYRTISLAFETALFLLTLYKFFSVLEITQFHTQSFMVTLVRDGTWAYAIIFGKFLRLCGYVALMGT